MPKRVKTVEEHLETIENLMVGILLRRQPNVRELAKIIGVSNEKITEMYPKRKTNDEVPESVSHESNQIPDQQEENGTSA